MQIHGLLVKSETEKASHRQSARGKQTSKPKRTKEAQELMTFVAECETRVNSEQAQKAASCSAQMPKNSWQKRCVQDSMAFDPSNRESLACPKCRHQNVVAITSHEEVMQQNAAFKEEYNKKLKAWNDEGGKGKKPSLKSTSQQMACFCTKAHCLLSQNGGTCFQCKLQGPSVGPDPNGGPSDVHCICQYCCCPCEYTFLASNHHRDSVKFFARATRQRFWCRSS